MNAPNELPKDQGLPKLTTASLLFLLAAVTVNAQQITGTPGSPSECKLLSLKVVPKPEMLSVRADNVLSSLLSLEHNPELGIMLQ